MFQIASSRSVTKPKLLLYKLRDSEKRVMLSTDLPLNQILLYLNHSYELNFIILVFRRKFEGWRRVLTQYLLKKSVSGGFVDVYFPSPTK